MSLSTVDDAGAMAVSKVGVTVAATEVLAVHWSAAEVAVTPFTVTEGVVAKAAVKAHVASSTNKLGLFTLTSFSSSVPALPVVRGLLFTSDNRESTRQNGLNYQ